MCIIIYVHLCVKYNGISDNNFEILDKKIDKWARTADDKYNVLDVEQR